MYDSVFLLNTPSQRRGIGPHASKGGGRRAADDLRPRLARAHRVDGERRALGVFKQDVIELAEFKSAISLRAHKIGPK
jgi:hypothetical protein